MELGAPSMARLGKQAIPKPNNARRSITLSQTGRVAAMDAGMIGRACVALGAGRAKASDAIDFAVGVSGVRKVGERVERGEPLLCVHARDQSTLATVLPLLDGAARVE